MRMLVATALVVGVIGLGNTAVLGTVAPIKPREATAQDYQDAAFLQRQCPQLVSIVHRALSDNRLDSAEVDYILEDVKEADRQQIERDRQLSLLIAKREAGIQIPRLREADCNVWINTGPRAAGMFTHSRLNVRRMAFSDVES